MAERKLKRLDFLTKEFEANGKKYYIEEQLSQDRWNMYELLEVEIGVNLKSQEIKGKMRELWDNLNAQNFADSCVICRDVMIAADRAYEPRIPECVRMCALFMNTENEDRRFITEDLIKQKAADWREEGIDMQSFFSFAIATIPGFIENFKRNFHGISE